MLALEKWLNRITENQQAVCHYDPGTSLKKKVEQTDWSSVTEFENNYYAANLINPKRGLELR